MEFVALAADRAKNPDKLVDLMKETDALLEAEEKPVTSLRSAEQDENS